MNAKFIYESPTTGASILRSAEGRVFTPLLPRSNNRVVMLLNKKDILKIDSGSEKYRVTDQMTGIVHTIRRADCGAGCRCAAEIVG